MIIETKIYNTIVRIDTSSACFVIFYWNTFESDLILLSFVPPCTIVMATSSLPGWTGILCDQKYETCTNQNGHECYNGGECILGLQDKYGNEQLFCDCSNAKGYVGKY